MLKWVNFNPWNKLSREDRARILHLLCEGNSIRAVTRLTGASKKAVSWSMPGRPRLGIRTGFSAT